MVSGKEKGSEFERQIARVLSAWLHPEGATTELIRSVQSGGWSAKNERQIGDLAPNGPYGEQFRECFSVECKHWREIQWWHVFSSPKSEFITFWRKTRDEAWGAELIPLYIIRQNRMPITVCFPDDLDTPVLTVQGLDGKPTTVFERMIQVRHMNMKAIPLDDFLLIDPDWYYDTWYPACRG